MQTADFLIQNLYDFKGTDIEIVAVSDAAKAALAADLGQGAKSVIVLKSYALPWLAKIARWGLSVESVEDLEGGAA